MQTGTLLGIDGTATQVPRLVIDIDFARRVWSSEATPVLGVDLFAGAGGFSLGALAAGVRVVAAVEIDKRACETYRSNLIQKGYASGTHLFDGDILDLSPLGLMDKVGLTQGRCDILLGGPPCQGFSSHRLNDAGVDDPRNQLLLRYFEFVDALRPKMFLVENVPGMLWPRHRDYVDAFYRRAGEIGYDLHEPETLNARDFGVPQNRRRVFLFGTRRSIEVNTVWPPPATHADPLRVSVDAPLPSWRSAGSVFAVPLDPADKNNMHMKHSAEMVAAFERTPKNGGSRRDSGRVLDCHRTHDGHSDVYGRIDPTAPGPTMTTACINPSKGRFVHPTEPHGITLRHAARFQTFPDWFEFEGGLMAGGAQVGNAVPVRMAAALIQPLVSALRSDRNFTLSAAA